MASLREKIRADLKKYHQAFLTKRVLRTMEEVAANTNEDNLPSAVVVSELYDNLKFPDGAGFYPDVKEGERGYNTDPARGAGTFHPFNHGEITHIDSDMMAKGTTNDVASVSKSYVATSNGTIVIFSFNEFTKSYTNVVTLNGATQAPTYVKSNFSGRYAAVHIIPVKKGERVNVSLTSTNVANYNISASYFMLFCK